MRESQTRQAQRTFFVGASENQGHVERRNEVQRGNPIPENFPRKPHNTTEGDTTGHDTREHDTRGMGKERREKREGRRETVVTELHQRAETGRS